MRRIGLALCAVLLAIGLARAAGMETRSTAVSATATNQTVQLLYVLSAKSILFVNDGANEVYVDLSNDGVAVATTTGWTKNHYIAAGGSLSFTSAPGETIEKIGVICDTGETTTLRIHVAR